MELITPSRLLRLSAKVFHRFALGVRVSRLVFHLRCKSLSAEESAKQIVGFT